MKFLTLKQRIFKERLLYRLAVLVGLMDCFATGFLAWSYEYGSGYGLHPAFFFATVFFVFVLLRLPKAPWLD